MGTVNFDTDELAARIRQYLTIGKYALSAARADADTDYRDALMSVSAARELAAITYHKLRATNDHEDLRRFAELSKEAAKLITDFWDSLGVVILKRVSTGETRVVHVEQAAPTKPVVRHLGKSMHKSGTKISNKHVVDMIEYFMAADDKKHTVGNKEFDILAEKYGVSNSAIYQRYKSYQSGVYNDLVVQILETRKSER